MWATEPQLICAGPAPYSERAAALLREEGVDAQALETPPPPPLVPIRFASELAPVVATRESQWLLYIRAGEMLPRPLAREIARVAVPEPRAFAYRIRRRLFDRTVPLLIDDPLEREGEIRLLHRRRARFQRDGRLTVQGTVVRLIEALHVEVGESGLTDVAGSGRGAVVKMVLRRPWLALHPPTLSFLVRNRRAINDWFDRGAHAPGSPGGS